MSQDVDGALPPSSRDAAADRPFYLSPFTFPLSH
jgi:hypothetical protein